MHPAATHYLPPFITAPGETDVLMVVMAVILAGAVLGFGILFLRLHSLPEHIAHKSHKLQFEIVAVLSLLALFTHIHLFWVAALLLALVDFPDFGGSLGRIAGSVEKMAGIKPGEGAAEVPDEEPARTQPVEVAADKADRSTGTQPSEDTGDVSKDKVSVLRRGEGVPAGPTRPELAPASTRS
jgi:hypothetical protein